MTLPYEWKPEGARRVRSSALSVGSLVAFEHEVWRVVAIHDRDPANMEPGGATQTVQLRPVGSDSFATSADEDIHLSGYPFYLFPSEHYPVCSKCSKPLPCPEVMAELMVARAAARQRRYEMPGVCPACEEPVSDLQSRQTWPDNLVVPNGQPVTFHLRDRCVGSAVKYDEKWRAAGHESLLGFEPNAEAVEKMLAELDGRDDWGRSGSSRTMRRYASLIPPKVNRRPRPCAFRLDGCLGKVTHTGCANGVALTSGCERCMARWVEDPDVSPSSAPASTCSWAHLHVAKLTTAQVRLGMETVRCGCRRGVLRLVPPPGAPSSSAVSGG